MPLSSTVRTLAVALALCVPAWGIGHAAEFPSRPVRLLTQGAAGSGPDVVVRVVAEHLSRLWGQQVHVVNQVGGGGIVAGKAAAGAEPDGYTLYAPTITTFVILPEMHDTLPFDLDRDFVPVGFVAETPMTIAVANALGVRSLDELVALAKARPSQLFYAANNRGSMPHLTGALFAERSGAPVTFVPYGGAAAALQDVMGGRVAIIVEAIGALAGPMSSGAIRAVAVASPERLPTHPDLPTVAETYPGFAAMGWFVLMAPTGAPPDVVRKINRDLNTVLAHPELVQRLHELGAFTRALSPEATGAYIRAESAAWRPVVRRIGLRSQ